MNDDTTAQPSSGDASRRLTDEEILSHFPGLHPSEHQRLLDLVRASEARAEAISQATGVKVGIAFGGRHFRAASRDGILTEAEILANLPEEMSPSERQAALTGIKAAQVRSNALHAIVKRIAAADAGLSDAEILAELPPGMSPSEQQAALEMSKARAVHLRRFWDELARRAPPGARLPDGRIVPVPSAGSDPNDIRRPDE